MRPPRIGRSAAAVRGRPAEALATGRAARRAGDAEPAAMMPHAGGVRGARAREGQAGPADTAAAQMPARPARGERRPGRRGGRTRSGGRRGGGAAAAAGGAGSGPRQAAWQGRRPAPPSPVVRLAPALRPCCGRASRTTPLPRNFLGWTRLEADMLQFRGFLLQMLQHLGCLRSWAIRAHPLMQAWARPGMATVQQEFEIGATLLGLYKTSRTSKSSATSSAISAIAYCSG